MTRKISGKMGPKTAPRHAVQISSDNYSQTKEKIALLDLNIMIIAKKVVIKVYFYLATLYFKIVL
jgi:hypothetical protein